MTGVGMWVAMLWIAASLVPDSKAQKNSTNRYLFHIPWACSVVWEGNLIGGCAIIETDKVLVSVDNFNDTAPGSTKRFHELIKDPGTSDVLVHAGSNFMDPTKLPREKQPSSVQTSIAKDLYVSFRRPDYGGKWDIRKNPSNLTKVAGADFDIYGLLFNVGVLVLKGAFAISPYVRPILLLPDVRGRASGFKQTLEFAPPLWASPCMTYSWNQKLNRIRYHDVTYQGSSECTQVYCTWDLYNCGSFPARDFHLCFKSVKYADVCPNARGAALFCPSFSNSVFGILTTAPTCGQKHLPGVYTVIDEVIYFLGNATNKTYRPHPRYNLYRLPQLNTDYDGVL